jgi:hypothetical protein
VDGVKQYQIVRKCPRIAGAHLAVIADLDLHQCIDAQCSMCNEKVKESLGRRRSRFRTSIKCLDDKYLFVVGLIAFRIPIVQIAAWGLCRVDQGFGLRTEVYAPCISPGARDCSLFLVSYMVLGVRGRQLGTALECYPLFNC